MSKSKVIYVPLVKNENIARDIYRMVLKIPKEEPAFRNTIPGQFVNVYLDEKDTLLPRPISICDVKDEELHLVYKVVGKGTQRMMTIKEGELVRITGPLGNGYSCPTNKRVLLIAGGTGIPSMVALAKRLKLLNCHVTSLLGYRDECFLVQDMNECCHEAFLAMETGDQGFKGNVVELLKSADTKVDFCYACGPKPMLKDVSEYCAYKNIELQVSLEERMGCGYGACLGCAVTINDPGPVKKRVCKDGPVFIGSQVVWDE